MTSLSGTFVTLYLIGWLFSELDKGTEIHSMLFHFIALILQPFASVAEGLAAVWALNSPQLGTFDVSHALKLQMCVVDSLKVIVKR